MSLSYDRKKNRSVRVNNGNNTILSYRDVEKSPKKVLSSRRHRGVVHEESFENVMAENICNTIDLSMSWTVLYERSHRRNVDRT